MNTRPSLATRVVKGFAMFWWDLLVGDTPELFVATLVSVGAVALLSDVAHERTLAVVALPLTAVVSLTLSVRRARRRSSRD